MDEEEPDAMSESQLVLPGEHEIMVSVERVVESYSLWLEVKSPLHHREFVHRLQADPEAARAEAVSFAYLRQQQLRPRPGEIIGQGGVDFICEPERRPHLAVEVTSVSIAAVTAASGLPHPAPPSGSFGQITTQLWREAINKAGQLADYPMPRVLLVTTEHEGGDVLMNAYSASELLTGSTAFRVRVGDVAAAPETVAALKNSVFFRFSRGKTEIEPARRSISAILLMTIAPNQGSVIGLLHPDPIHPLDTSTFPRVHFVRLTAWPVHPGDRLRVEWLGPMPSPTLIVHSPVMLDDVDLRQP